MKYFIIHSGSNYNEVKKIIVRLEKSIPSANFFILETPEESWEEIAKQNINSSDKIIFFANSNMEEKTNLEYELEHAINNGKDVYVYKLDKTARINQKMANLLKCNTTLSDKENVFLKINELKSRIRQDIIEPKLYNHGSVNQLQEFIEQYKIWITTSEDLVKRKQTTNNIYVTLNLAILSILIAIAGLDSKSYGVFISLFGIDFTTKVSAWIVVGFFGTLLCISWLMVLKNYANLNSAKMSLIIQIEKNLPLNLFDTEWKYVALKNKRGKYIPFSRSEKLRAYLFLFFYILVILGGIILIGRQFINK